MSLLRYLKVRILADVIWPAGMLKYITDKSVEIQAKRMWATTMNCLKDYVFQSNLYGVQAQLCKA